MKKNRQTLLLLLCLLPLTLFAQPQSFTTLYGSGYHPVAVHPELSSLFTVAFDPPAIANTDATGLPLDFVKFIHPGVGKIIDMIPSPNQGFYVAGQGAGGMFLMEVGFNLQPIWFRMYGGVTANRFFPVPFGGGFVLSANETGSNKIRIFKTNVVGLAEWRVAIDLDNEDEQVTGAIRLKFGSYVATGTVSRPGQSQREAFLLQLDENGFPYRAHTLETGNAEVPLSIYPTSTGGFLLGGYSMVNGQQKGFITHFDSTMQPLWSRQILPDSSSRMVQVIEGYGEFISVAEINVGGDSLENDVLIQVWDELGNVQKARRMVDAGLDRHASLPRSSVAYFLCGESVPPGTFNGYLRKIRPDLPPTCGDQDIALPWDTLSYTNDSLSPTLFTPSPSLTDTFPLVQNTSILSNSDCITIGIESSLEDEIQIYPNPTAGSFRLEMPELEGKTQLRLLDVRGRELWSRSLDQQELQQRFALPQGGEGLYFLEIISEKGRVVKKILAQP